MTPRGCAGVKISWFRWCWNFFVCDYLLLKEDGYDTIYDTKRYETSADLRYRRRYGRERDNGYDTIRYGRVRIRGSWAGRLSDGMGKISKMTQICPKARVIAGLVLLVLGVNAAPGEYDSS